MPVQDEVTAMSSINIPLSQLRLGVAQVAESVWRTIHALEIALQVRRERRVLLSMDDRALKDIGLNRGDAYAEAHRSFWDVPRDPFYIACRGRCRIPR